MSTDCATRCRVCVNRRAVVCHGLSNDDDAGPGERNVSQFQPICPARARVRQPNPKQTREIKSKNLNVCVCRYGWAFSFFFFWTGLGWLGETDTRNATWKHISTKQGEISPKNKGDSTYYNVTSAGSIINLLYETCAVWYRTVFYFGGTSGLLDAGRDYIKKDKYIVWFCFYRAHHRRGIIFGKNRKDSGHR